MLKTETRKVPAAATRFAAELQPQAGEFAEGTPIPLSLVARTAGVANHRYWGRAVHDFAGMVTTNPRIPIDYIHDGMTALGFAENPQVDSGNLRLAATFVSLGEGDKAAEIAAKARAGVPYQCSITMGQFSVEEVPEGMQAEANGQTFTGPVAIFRQWELRGVAVCLFGSDSGTALEFGHDSDQEFAVEVTKHVPDETKPDSKPLDAVAIARQYRDEFGEPGLQYLADGLDLDAARKKFTADLVADRNRLKTELQQSQAALTELRGTNPVGFGTTAPEGKPDNVDKPAIDEFSHLPPGQAQYCRAMKASATKATNN